MTSHRVLIGLVVVLGINSQLNTRHLHWVGAVPRSIVKTLANPPASLLHGTMVGIRGEDPGPAIIPADANEQKLNELLTTATAENRRLWEENRHLRDQLDAFSAAAAVRGSVTINLLPARVADYNPSRSNPSIELDKGSRAGVETDNPVIVSANLVGFIQGDVGTLRSSARLVTAPDTRYAIRLIRPGSSTDEFGGATYIYTDDSGEFFYCDLPDGTHDIAVGDLASMADDRYPQALGYILGVVGEVRLDHPENPLELDRIIIRPAVDPSRLRDVSIQVKEQRHAMNWLIFSLMAYVVYVLQAGLSPVWTLGARTEPRVMLILLVFIALQASPVTVAFAALALGLLHDIQYAAVDGLVGPWALGYLAAGYTMIQLRNLLFRDSVFTIAIMTLVAGVFAYLVPTALYSIRGVSFFLGQPVAGFSAANALFQGFLDLLFTAVVAFPVGYALIKSRDIWAFPNSTSRGRQTRKNGALVAVAVGMRFKPPPGIRDHLGDVGAFRGPAQFVPDLRGVGVQRRRVAGTAGAHLRGDGVARDLAAGLDDLHHGRALARAEVVKPLVAVAQRPQHRDVRIDQVLDVDVVADARAIGGVVVVAEDADLLDLAQRAVQHDGDDVRLRLVVLADVSARVRAGDVEVPQRREGEVAVCVGEVDQRALGHQLRPAVGVDRLLGEPLGDGHLVLRRLAIGRAGRAEHDPLHAHAVHRGEQGHRPGRVVVVVLQRVVHGLADVRECSEVDHRLDRVFLEDRFDGVRVAQVGDLERRLAAARHRGGINRGAVAPVEVVQHGDGVPVRDEPLHAVRADVAGAAGHEDVHWGRHGSVGS